MIDAMMKTTEEFKTVALALFACLGAILAAASPVVLAYILLRQRVQAAMARDGQDVAKRLDTIASDLRGGELRHTIRDVANQARVASTPNSLMAGIHWPKIERIVGRIRQAAARRRGAKTDQVIDRRNDEREP